MASDRLFGAVQQLLGLGQEDQNDENLNEQEQARKKRQKLQSQQGMLSPWSGAASSLFNRSGNQF